MPLIMRVLAGECQQCHKLTAVSWDMFPDSPRFDPTEVVEIKCAHCGRIFRLLSQQLFVCLDSPELRPPNR